MTIQVQFFAQLRDAFGAGQQSVEAKEGATVREVVDALLREPRAQRMKSLPMLFAVNETWVKSDQVLTDGDRLALLPPVSGG